MSDLGPERHFDLLVVGSGPAGATAALRAARRGLRVALLERGAHPRFHIGESLLPRQMMLVRELGLEERLRGIPSTLKLGASFTTGHGSAKSDFHFDTGLVRAPPDTLNVERSHFDSALVDAAREAGADVSEHTSVRAIDRLTDGDVRLTARTPEGPVQFRGKWLIDASGQSTLVGRHLATRTRLPDLERVAYFGHLTGVDREAGVVGGFPLIVMCREGWFWMIPIDEDRTSIGLVMEASVARTVGLASNRMLAWGIRNCPAVRDRTLRAVFPETNHVEADFSYTCRPYSGPGYFLVGDAATFVDPIFSTGVCMGMVSAVAAADGVADVLAGQPVAAIRRRHIRLVESSSAAFFRLVRGFYRHAFRELFLNGTGPFSIHRAVISTLCGHVFPAPPRALRWRLRLFDLCVRIQPFVAIVPRRPEFSLLDHARGAAD